MPESTRPIPSPQTPTGVLRVQVLVNPNAGSSNAGDTAVQAVAMAFAAAGIAADVKATPAGSVAGAVGRAVERFEHGEVDAVVVGGGDGTVSAATAAIAGTGVPLGILPLGTLNHFAKDAGIPLPLDHAVAAIAARNVRLVDVGDMNGTVFVNNSSVGIYPRVVVGRDLLRRTHGIGKWPAMAVAMLRVLRGLSHRRLRVEISGHRQTVRTSCLFVGNNEYGTQVFNLGRRARLDGGELWLYVVKPVGVLGLLRLAARMALGLLDVERDLIVFRGTDATIRTRRPRRLLVALDGEVISADTPLRYTLRPKALALFAPPEQPRGDPR
jgi:diacylglycerol kinase family enzyme